MLYGILIACFALGLWYGCQLITHNFTIGNILMIIYGIFIGGLYFGKVPQSLEKFGKGKQAAAEIFIVINREPLVSRNINGNKI